MNLRSVASLNWRDILPQVTWYHLSCYRPQGGKSEKLLLKRTAEDIVLTGKDLNAVQEKLRGENQGSGYRGEDHGNGLFVAWLNDEFEMSKSTAYRFMQVAETFGEKFPLLLSTN